MNQYCIDSDVLIHFLKGDPKVLKLFNQLKGQGRSDTNTIGISIVSVGEILEGLQETKRADRKKQFLELIKRMEVYPIDLSTINHFAQIRHQLRKGGKLINDLDLLIAASCLHHQATLVTNNLKHFKRIKGLSVYSG